MEKNLRVKVSISRIIYSKEEIHLDFIDSKKILPRPKTKPSPGTRGDTVLFDAPEISGALSPLRRSAVPNLRDGKDFPRQGFKDFPADEVGALGSSERVSELPSSTAGGSSYISQDNFKRKKPALGGVSQFDIKEMAPLV